MLLAVFGPMQIIVILSLIVGLLITIFYNLTLQKAMAAVSKHNQSVAPGLIWLNLIPIPFLNSIWTMIFGILACNAINKDAGKKIAPSALAVIYPSISIFTSILALIMNATASYRGPEEEFLLIVGVLSLTTFVLWIIFWVQINNARNKLQRMGRGVNISDSLDSGMQDITKSSSSSVQSELSDEKQKIELIKDYQALLNEGTITREEFEKKKKEILGGE